MFLVCFGAPLRRTVDAEGRESSLHNVDGELVRAQLLDPAENVLVLGRGLLGGHPPAVSEKSLSFL